MLEHVTPFSTNATPGDLCYGTLKAIRTHNALLKKQKQKNFWQLQGEIKKWPKCSQPQLILRQVSSAVMAKHPNCGNPEGLHKGVEQGF